MEYKLPRPLSHSSLSMYQECPQKYKFKYIDALPEKPRHFFSFGQSVHLALEFFYGVKALPAPTLKEVLGHYKEQWVSRGYKDQAQEQKYFEDGKVILSEFHKKHIDSYHIPFFVEYSFNISVDGVPVTGKIDRVDKLPDGRLAVLDYKTGKALAAGRERSDAQLTMYQLACESMLGAEVAKLSFYHLPSQTEISVERHEAPLVDALKERIVKTAEGVTEGSFQPKPEERKCFWCDFKPLCPIFKPSAGAAPLAGEPSALRADEELAGLIDRYGELTVKLGETQEQAENVKKRIMALLREKNYVRAFGKSFEIYRSGVEKWEFSDKKKVLELIKKAGLYERVLAPSAPLVHQLMSDPELDRSVKDGLRELGTKVEASDLKVKPL
jgi:RecB family exonuclease